VLSFCGRRDAIGARSDKLNDLDMRTDLGIVAPSRQQLGRLEHCPSAGKWLWPSCCDWPDLAPIPVVSALRTNDDVSTRELPMKIEHAKLKRS
jgi:hypothetical protein